MLCRSRYLSNAKSNITPSSTLNVLSSTKESALKFCGGVATSFLSVKALSFGSCFLKFGAFTRLNKKSIFSYPCVFFTIGGLLYSEAYVMGPMIATSVFVFGALGISHNIISLIENSTVAAVSEISFCVFLKEA